MTDTPDTPTPELAPPAELDLTKDLLNPLCANLAQLLQKTPFGFTVIMFRHEDFAPDAEITKRTPLWAGQLADAATVARVATTFVERLSSLDLGAAPNADTPQT